MKPFIIITGLPASGKSTLARALAHEFNLSFLDKDEYLESLFEAKGVGDSQWRRKLSRIADQDFQAKVEQSEGAILTSWWKHPRSSSDSGTPTEWLFALPGITIEIFCRCSPEVAARRFISRKRHPGHLDQQKSHTEIPANFTQQAALGPLHVGTLIEVNTENEVDVAALVERINQIIVTGQSY